jgi:hypothetical protein
MFVGIKFCNSYIWLSTVWFKGVLKPYSSDMSISLNFEANESEKKLFNSEMESL